MNHQKLTLRIQELIRRLEAGDRVSKGSLKRVLSTTQLAELETEVNKSSSKEAKPVEIERYETLLRRCLRLHKRHNEEHLQLTDEKSNKLREKVQGKLEEAHLYACELVLDKPALREWFDRDPATIEISTPESLPCIVSQNTPKRGRKLEMLGSALKYQKEDSVVSHLKPLAPVVT
jgi:hypothetical protein